VRGPRLAGVVRGAWAILFEGNIMSSKEQPGSSAAGRDAIYSSVKSRSSATTARGRFARSSNGGCYRSPLREAPSRNMRQGVAEAAQRKRTQRSTGVVISTVHIVRFRTPSIDPLAYVSAIGRYS
jgi:hypothetical protein